MNKENEVNIPPNFIKNVASLANRKAVGVYTRIQKERNGFWYRAIKLLHLHGLELDWNDYKLLPR